MAGPGMPGIVPLRRSSLAELLADLAVILEERRECFPLVLERDLEDGQRFLGVLEGGLVLLLLHQK